MFVSPFEHDPSSIKTIREVITKGEEHYSYIQTSLEELLLFRLESEWEERNSLSSWLEQIQLADWLGQYAS